MQINKLLSKKNDPKDEGREFLKKEIKYYREIEMKKDNLTKIKVMFIRNRLY